MTLDQQIIKLEAKNDATLDVIHDLSAATSSDELKIKEENEEKVMLLTSELEQVDDEITAIEELFSNGSCNDSRSTVRRLKEIYAFVSDLMTGKHSRDLREFIAVACQTNIGGINSASGEIGFEDSTNEVPYEARKIILFMRRVKGSEGRASCYWTCKLSNPEDGDMNMLCQHEGYVSFEDGEVFAELEVDIEPYILEKKMNFIFSIEDIRGCRISSDLNQSTCVTVNPPENIPKGFGFVEFVKDTYSGNEIIHFLCDLMIFISRHK